MAKKSLKQLLTTNTMIDLAGEQYFSRGENYFDDGAVKDIVVTNGVIRARVRGTTDYRTRIWVDKGELDHACSCPLGQDYEFCKHLVATGLAWLETGQSATRKRGSRTSRSKGPNKPTVFEVIRAHLETLPPKQLVDMLMEQTAEHEEFRNLLYAQSATTLNAGERDLEVHRRFIRQAIEVDDYIDYREMYDYVQRVDPVITLLQNLLSQDRAGEVMELALYALSLINEAYNNLGDDGYFSMTAQEISDLHVTACENAKPDPAQLAETIFTRQMQDDWGLMDFTRYRKALGQKGMQAFKDLALQQWRNTPKRIARDSDGHDAGHYTLTGIVRQLAELEEDVDALIEIEQKDLSSAHRYWVIATTCVKAKRYNEALQWAEKGLKAFPDDNNSGLIEFLAKEYHRRKRHDEAVQLMWGEFARLPGLNTYQALKASAVKAKDWKSWRARALEWVRQTYLPGLKRGRNSRWDWHSGGHSLLVEIFMWEQDIESALAEARQGGCGEQLWLELARACEKNRPAEAINIYQEHIGAIIEQTDNQAYDHAARILKKIKELMKALKQARQFAPYIEQLRTEYKRKRNFIKKIQRL